MTARSKRLEASTGRSVAADGPDRGGWGLAVVALLCFFPYISVGPLSAPSQVQPWAAVAAWMWVIFRALTGRMKLSALQVLLIAFSVWFLARIYGGSGFDLSIYFRRSGAFLLSTGIVLALQYIRATTLWRVLCVTIPVWTAFGLLRYAVPAVYYQIVTPLVPTVVVSDIRGSSSLAPEATDFGFTMVFLVALAIITRTVLKDRGLHPATWPIWLGAAGALVSKSGTGFFGLAVLALVYFVSQRSSSRRVVAFAVVTLAAVVGWYVLVALPPTGIRGLDLLTDAARSPSSLLDGTAVYRAVHNAVGILGFADSGYVGYGAGAFLSIGPEIYYQHNLGSVFNIQGYYASSVPASLAVSPLSFIAVILLEYGLVGVAYLFVIFRHVARSRIPYRSIAFVFMLIAWAQSFPAAWPLFWVMLALTFNEEFLTGRGGRVQPDDAQSRSGAGTPKATAPTNPRSGDPCDG